MCASITGWLCTSFDQNFWMSLLGTEHRRWPQGPVLWLSRRLEPVVNKPQQRVMRAKAPGNPSLMNAQTTKEGLQVRLSSPSENTILVSPSVPPMPRCLCLACTSVPILGQLLLRLKGSGNYSSKDTSASRAQMTLVQIACLKPEKVLAPR